MQRAGWLLGVLLILNSELRAQTTASIRVEVADLQGGPIAGADVRLENLLTGFRTSEVTDADGTVALSNIPLQRYTLTVAKTNFETAQQALELRSNVPQQVKIQLALGSTATSIQVVASDLYETVDPQATGTRSELNMAVISRVPAAPGTRGLESMLLSLPGFAANANGAIHPRGAHNQMTFVIDGMPISDQLTGAFANSVDPSMVQTVELFTGDIPAEFGNKVSGVAVITTRSGMGTGRALGGSIQLFGGGFDTAGQVTQVSGGGARWGYFSSLTTLKSNRYLDQVSRDNLHNGGNSERVFTRLDRELTQRSQSRVTAMAGRSSFQLANLRSQHAAGQDQRQDLRDAALSVGYLRSIGTSSTWDSTVSYRTSIAQLYGSEFDTPVTADQARHLSTFTAGTRFNRDGGWHVLRAGVDYQLFPVSENFSFGITDPTFNAPGSEGFVPTLLQHDISRGGSRFVFSGKDEGRLYSAFLQETLRFGPLTTSIGMRYDRYDFLSRGNQLQPRIGIAYHIRKTATVLRASYNRTYQTPPNENLLLASAEATA
ncbi:MAG TPA: TonB-dependent receptor, partial [Bryobacteraceae bacterium]|nr:TonB-dependent receptor [Bryobacteraceae bacterium]